MGLVNIVFIAIALNIDALSAGISYGIRRIKIPFSSILIISIISMVAISLSMLSGQFLTVFLPETFTQLAGGIILIILGSWAMYQFFKELDNGKDEPIPEESEHIKQKPITVIKINFLGLIIHILKKPYKADLDKSGVISYGEAVLLGIALSMDSMAAGIAISLFGYSILKTTALVGLNYLIFTFMGLSIGDRLNRSFMGKYIQALPGIILISLGLTKIVVS